MTNVEAIEILKRLQDPEPWEPQLNYAAYNALNMAISALEKQEQKKPLTNDETPIKCTGLNCPMQAGKVDPATCKAADTCEWATKPLTNADKLRALKDEEMAEWFCAVATEFNVDITPKEWLDWLKQEVKDNEL